MVIDALKRCGVVLLHERTLGSALACLAAFEYDLTFAPPNADDLYHSDIPRILKQFPKDAKMPEHGQREYGDDPNTWFDNDHNGHLCYACVAHEYVVLVGVKVGSC